MLTVGWTVKGGRTVKGGCTVKGGRRAVAYTNFGGLRPLELTLKSHIYL